MNGAGLLVRCLENEGVRYVFALPGEEIIDICDSLSRSSIESIIVRHEQTAAFMADVYGRLTGRAGVCLSTLGPGATNLTTGVADANLDRSPLVAITGQAEQEEIHKEFHQYIDIVHLFEPITKWNTRISRASVIPEITRKAFKIAEAEKPGACHFEVPRDVLNEESKTKPVTRETPKATGPNLSSVKRAVDIIKKSEYPLILAGNGVIRGRASKELRQFASSANIQVAETFMGKGSMSWEDKLFLSPIGLQMFDYVGCGLQRADTIIAIGYDFVEYAPKLWNPKRGKKIIHINALPAEVDSHYVPEVEVVGDIGLTLGMLSKWVHRPLRHISNKLKEFLLEEIKTGSTDEAFPIKPQRIVSDLRKVMGKEDILVSDVGAHKLWIARMYPTYEPNTVIISNGFSSMGVAIPGAIAAKLIHPNRKIVAVCGDGGFLMSSYELETAKRIRTPIMIVIFRDDAYGLVKWKQQTMHKREDSSIIGNPDFVKYAEAFGALGYRVNRAQDLESVLREALEQKICSVIDVPVDYAENMKLTMKLGEFVCPT